ncbi:unnamed protein product [Penicillium salamii]|nr:unnamed protein product [Penicillium salamii]CAG8278013.1 unnamed protein product [Penicillium salamii]
MPPKCNKGCLGHYILVDKSKQYKHNTVMTRDSYGRPSIYRGKKKRACRDYDKHDQRWPQFASVS